MAKYLDSSGLSQLWTACKNTFLTPGGGDERYLKLSGGTLTGTLTMTGQKIVLGDSGAIVFSTVTSTDWSSPQNSGIRILNTAGYSRDGAPTNYSVAISVQGYYGFQLACCGATNDFRIRSTSAGSNNYDPEPWVVLLHSSNYSTYCATANHTHSYLPLSGGIMTGALTMGNGARRFILGPDVSFVADFSADTGGWADTLLGVKDKDGVKTLISCYGSNSSGLNYGTLGGVWSDPAARIYMDGFEVLKSRSITPSANNSYYCGGNSYKWAAVYSNQFIKDTNSTNILLANGNTLAQSTFSGSGHNHDGIYLKLSGGTQAGDITITDMNVGLRYKVNYLSGWARSFISFYQHTDSDSSKAIEEVWKIGTHGDTNGYIYSFIGGDYYYGEKNLRFYKNGDIKIGSNIIYHAGNLPAYPTKASWDYDDRYLKLSGGTVSGVVDISSTGSSRANLNLISTADVPNDLYWGSNGTKHFSLSSRHTGENNNFLFYSVAAGATAYIDYATGVWKFIKSPTVNGNKIWNESNDGSGSGMDADLLDGQHGSYYATSSHNHDSTYLKLSGGTMSNTNVVTNLNADLLDGYNSTSFLINKRIRSDQDSIYDLRWNFGTFDKGDYQGTYKGEYPTNYGTYLSLTYNNKNTGALIFFDCPTSNALGHVYVSTRGAGDSNTTFSSWDKLAYITDNVASATYATTAGGVAWDNVTGKPSTFTPASHNHDGSYLKLSGGSLTGSLSVTGSVTVSDKFIFPHGGSNYSWERINESYNRTSIRAYCTAGEEATGARDKYTIGLMVDGYYSFALGAYSGGYNLAWRDCGGTWRDIITAGNYTSYCATASHNHDSSYLKLSGGTTTGAVTFGGEVYSYHISVGHPIGTYDRNRAEVDIVTAADTATDLWMGVNKSRCWDFSCRNDATGNRLDVYNKDILQRFYYTQDGLFYAYGGFVKNGSDANHVLLGNGGHKAVSDFATSGHNHNSAYINKSNGSLSENISFSRDTYITYSPYSGWSSWARTPYRITDGTTTFAFGGYGDSGTAIGYAFIGTSYDSTRNIRVYPSTDPTVGGNTIIHAGNYTSYCATSGHNHDNTYVKRSGNTTMSGNLTFTSENSSIYKMPRKKSGGGGWAYSPVKFVGNDDQMFFNIGGYGDDDQIEYAFIGIGDYYSSNNLRIYANSVRWGSNTIYHTGNHTSLTNSEIDAIII